MTKLILCWFGLVKNVSQEQVDAYRKHVVECLSKSGDYDIVSVLHTHEAKYTSKWRNHESVCMIHQKPSIARILTLCPMLESKMSAADDTWLCSHEEIEQMAAIGDPWEDHGESIRCFIRQLHSLNECALMLEDLSKAQTVKDDDIAIFLRPDVLFDSDLDVACIKRTVGCVVPSVCLPNYASHGGYNDRLMCGPVSTMIQVASRGKRLCEYVFRLKNQPHSESFLAWILDQAGIQVNHMDDTHFVRVRANKAVQND